MADDRIAAIKKRLAGISGPVGEVYAEAARAQKDHGRVEAFKARLATLEADAIAAAGDAELEACVEEDAEALHSEVDAFARDTPLKQAFFKPPPPKTEDEKVPEPEGDPDAYRAMRLAWRLGDLDLEHPKHWPSVEGYDALSDLLERAKHLEGATWAEVHAQSKHNHEWHDWSKWSKSSRDRLEVLELDDRSGWYQLHIDKRGRIYGYRTGNVLNIVWWDRDHEVYVTKKK